MRVMALPVPIFQSTLPARGATATRIPVDTHSIISIHAPRTGSDAPLCDGVAVGGISIHAPRTGSDAISLYCGNSVAEFQSTLPARGATGTAPRNRADAPHFNPRSPHGERQGQRIFFCQASEFQSTLPARGATSAIVYAPRSTLFQSTLPARGATPTQRAEIISADISIHAPRTGSDRVRDAPTRAVVISIHAPRTGSDAPPRRKRLSPERFQSTLPARGATGIWLNACFASLHFNPRSPHGERLHACLAVVLFRGDISIHAPRTGSDCRSGFHLPLLHISIHAPRTGSDAALPAAYVHGLYFNPRSPHGERPDSFTAGGCRADFNPRSPHGERPGLQIRSASSKHFNPRSPHGERRGASRGGSQAAEISIHAPRTGSDVCVHLVHTSLVISIHAPRTGSDATEAPPRPPKSRISIHAPRTGSDNFGNCYSLYYAISIHAPRTGSD